MARFLVRTTIGQAPIATKDGLDRRWTDVQDIWRVAKHHSINKTSVSHMRNLTTNVSRIERRMSAACPRDPHATIMSMGR
eukprot:1212547-Lingulodinium_polyedra.AAC.1